jgi:uncharacterized protein (TIGR02679 family)
VTEFPASGASGASAASVAGPERLHRLLGGEPVAWLVRRVAERMADGRPLTGQVTLTAATAEQRRAVERLTGRAARSGTSLSVSLTEVDRILRESGAAPGGLAEAVTLLAGPVPDRNQDRAERKAAWDAAYAVLDEAVEGRPGLLGWREWLGATGLVLRLAPDPGQARLLLTQVAAVLRRVPGRSVPIGRLAAECCGDAHALDDGSPVGTLALSAVRALAGLPFAADGTADSRRAAWAAAGVHLDDLSSLVLCLGLPGDTGTPLGRMLASCHEAGQPVVLTLRQLRCHEAPLRAARVRTASARAVRVRICENPVVVAAAADQLGAACQPLVCVRGQPSAAAWRLLDLLASGGTEFGYHGDFDWGGVRIARAVCERVDARPWRYDRAAYEAALLLAPLAKLTGAPAETPWDPGLAASMRRHNLRVEEELVLDAMLEDLADAGRS